MKFFKQALEEIKDNFNLIKLKFKLPKIIEHIEENRSIIFNVVRIYPNILHYELFIAFNLANRGCRVKILIDNGVLEHWDSIQKINFSGWYTLYQASFVRKTYLVLKSKLIFWVYRHPNIEIIYYSNLFDRKKEYVFESSEYDLSKYINPSVRRFFQTDKPQQSNIEFQRYFELSKKNAEKGLELSKIILEKYAPSVFITSHAIYTTWGPMYDYMKNNNVKCVVYGPHSYIKQSYLITDCPLQLPYRDSSWKAFYDNHLKLTSNQRDLVIQFFENRIHKNTLDLKKLHEKVQYDKVNIKKLDNNSKVYAMFPNIIWDGDLDERHILFDSVVDWVISTVEIISKTKHHLIIRFHPAENKQWTNSVKLENIVRKRFPQIDGFENITLISSKQNIDTYNFIKDNVDVGLIYNGTLSTELIYMKIPVIACSMTRYKDYKIEVIPENIDEYEELLKNYELITKCFFNNYDEKLEIMLKLMYWYNFEDAYHMPLLDSKIPMLIDLNNIQTYDLDQNKNKDLLKTIDKFSEDLRG